MKKAKLIQENLKGFNGCANLYETTEDVTYNEDKKTTFLIVSAVNAFGMGNETYIFPADKDGEILDWSELEGYFKGSLDHNKALNNAGFTIE